MVTMKTMMVVVIMKKITTYLQDVLCANNFLHHFIVVISLNLHNNELRNAITIFQMRIMTQAY
jgi:hypothetical protein